MSTTWIQLPSLCRQIGNLAPALAFLLNSRPGDPYCVGQSVSSVAQCCPTLCNPMDCSTPGLMSLTNSWSSPKLMSIELVTPSNHLILCRPLLLLPSIFPKIWVFSNESVLHIIWPKYWSFSLGISPSSEYSGLISFSIDWFDLLAVHRILKSRPSITV